MSLISRAKFSSSRVEHLGSVSPSCLHLSSLLANAPRSGLETARVTLDIYPLFNANANRALLISKVLVARNANVYITSQTTESGRQTVDDIASTVSKGNGSIEFIVCNLADLASVKTAAAEFLRFVYPLRSSNVDIDDFTPEL